MLASKHLVKNYYLLIKVFRTEVFNLHLTYTWACFYLYILPLTTYFIFMVEKNKSFAQKKNYIHINIQSSYKRIIIQTFIMNNWSDRNQGCAHRGISRATKSIILVSQHQPKGRVANPNVIKDDPCYLIRMLGSHNSEY